MAVATRDHGTANGRITIMRATHDGPMARPEKWVFEYDPNTSWPEVPFGLGLTTQLVWLTPELAAEWLTKRHTRQRTVKHRHQESLTEDVAAGRFRLNGEAIIFDWDGCMVDGQHRCNAVVETGKPVLVTVVRGIAPEVYSTIDDTAKRTGGDALKANAVSDPSNVAAAVVMMERYRRGLILKSALVLSPAHIAEIVRGHPGLVESVAVASTLKEFPSRAALGMCHYVLSGISRTDADLFFDRLRSGAGLTKTDAVLTLRNRLHKESMHRDEVVFLVFKAWNYWRRRKPLKCLKRAEGESLSTPE